MIEIGPCTTNAIEKHDSSLHIDRTFIGARPHVWYATLTILGGKRIIAHADTLQTALDALEIRVARQPESDGVSK